MFYIFCILSYLSGSIPTAIWLSKRFYGIDIREHGSGNAGATNVFRVLGTKAGIIVFSFDTFKGFIFPFLFFTIQDSKDINITLSSLIIGLFAIVGHLYPVFAKFKGGKGVATSFGVVLAVFTLPALLCLFIFIIVFLLFKYVSVASLTSTISFVFFIFLFYNNLLVRILSIIIAIAIFYTHRSNIKRLLEGKENKIIFKK